MPQPSTMKVLDLILGTENKKGKMKLNLLTIKAFLCFLSDIIQALSSSAVIKAVRYYIHFLLF